MNIFADKDDKDDKGSHPPLQKIDDIIGSEWLQSGIYYFPKTTEYNQQWDGMNRWWRWQETSKEWHYAGYEENRDPWENKEPVFRERVRRLAEVAANINGAHSSTFDLGSTVTIARQLNDLGVDLVDYVGEKGGDGLVSQYYKLDVPRSAFQGTAGGFFAYRIWDLSLRLLDMSDQLNELDEEITRIRDSIKPSLDTLYEKASAWVRDTSSTMDSILVEWYNGTSSGTETWNDARGQFQIKYADAGDGHGESWGIVGDDITDSNINQHLRNLWLKKLNPVIIAAGNAYDKMNEVFSTSFSHLPKEWDKPEGAPPPGIYSGDGKGGGGGNDGGPNYEDILKYLSENGPGNEDGKSEGGGNNEDPPPLREDPLPIDGPVLANGSGDGPNRPPLEQNSFGPNGPGNLGLNGPNGPDGGASDGQGSNNPKPPPLQDNPLGFNGPNGGSDSDQPPIVPPPLPNNFPSSQASGGNSNPSRSRPPLETDPVTGLPIDPQTGEPFPVDPESGVPYNPDTGLPLNFDPETGRALPINPMTGEPIEPGSEPPTLETDPVTGLPIDPQTGEPFPVDPESGVPYNPDTGLPLNFDPETGELLPVDPMTGQSMAPETGLPVNDATETGGSLPTNGPAGETPPPLASDPIDVPSLSDTESPPLNGPSKFGGSNENPGRSPGESDRSTLFAGPPPSAPPPTTEPLALNGPGSSNGGGPGNSPAPQQSNTGPGSSAVSGPGPGMGAGTGTGTDGGTGGGSGMGSEMGNAMGMGRGMPPMMPPMGGMGGAGGGQNNRERERSTWLSEDERVWGTAEGRKSNVLGRRGPGTDKRSGQRNEYVEPGGERTRTGSSGEDPPRSGGHKRKPGASNRRSRGKEQTRHGDGEREG